MKASAKYLFGIGMVLSVLTWVSGARTGFSAYIPLAEDAPVAVADTDSLHYPIKDRYGDPLSNPNKNPLDLKDPSNIKTTVEYNKDENQYDITEKVGTLDYRPPSYMTFDEYVANQYKKSTFEYWRERAGAEDKQKRGPLVPPIRVPSKAFKSIFGTDVIEIRPQGSAELIFGINVAKNGNPNLPVQQQTVTTFDFKERIQMNVTANIGDKMKLAMNYNTEATFDFENRMKLQYQGHEDEIIKNIEAGNVSLPLNGTLIQGSQSLFGIKTSLQFGALTVTALFSQQRGKSSSITVQGGAQTSTFDIRADQYEANRHYFLAQFFADRYDQALSKLPIIQSSVLITKLEVWVTNKTGITENTRNILGFIDLGEYNYDSSITPGFINNLPPYNVPYPTDSSNNLRYEVLDTNYRNVFDASKLLTQKGQPYNYTSSKNWEKIENARKLNPNEYTLNPQLGYISLNQALNADEVLGVAFQYTVDNNPHQVGDFSTDGISAPSVLWVKMLKSTITNPRVFTWDLMMKNIYPLNAYNISAKDFQLEILYQDDSIGSRINYLPKGCTDVKGVRLISLLNLDRVNVNRDPYPDGVFDIIEGITINLGNGRVIFPVREPFGSYIQNKIYNPNGTCNSTTDKLLADKYGYRALYDSTKNSAQQQPEKNKFSLKGSYKGSSGSEISLNAVNVPQGSVTVTAGGILLKENVDYTVDYTLGRVKIINQGYLNSNTPLKVNLESNSLFNIQTKTMFGGRFDYVVNKDFLLGGTFLHLKERPLTQKVGIGDEPISNTIWGVDGTYRKDSRFLTKAVDKLPLIATKEASNVMLTGEFANIVPGHASVIGASGISYIDDFEAAVTPIDLKNPGGWFLASTPQYQNNLFPEGNYPDSLPYGFNRAKLAWYIVDPMFQQELGSVTPGNVTDVDFKHNWVREVPETEIFPNRSTQYRTAITCLNLAYYPNQRGPYNYDTDPARINPDGTFKDPETRWGGIQRRIETNDFEASNIGIIQFWMMDPFNQDNPNAATSKGGELYFDLGDVSEDVLRDSHKSFENGLPAASNSYTAGTSTWGRYPTIQAVVNAFDNDETSRSQQDVGLDGLADDQERTFFSNYLNALATNFGTTSGAYQSASADPSSDDYTYFQNSNYDKIPQNSVEAQPVFRYKKYNGQEGNSPAPPVVDGYNATGTNVPDGEDVNRDNNMNETESYFQYRVRLRPSEMNVGQGYITDVIDATVQGQPGKRVKWYQFKIPIRQPDKVVNGIQDFKSIRFIRMFMKGWQDSVVCRFARLELQRSDWRKYEKKLLYSSEYNPSEYPGNTYFDVSGVSIVDNGNRQPINYVLPPGITRQVDPTTQTQVQLNEQALSMRVCDLEDGDSRAAFKTMQLDIRRYGKMQMNIHAEGSGAYLDALNKGDLSAFVRIGSDFTENYYEYEIPLTFTNSGVNDPYQVWPDANFLDLQLEQLVNIKQQRNNAVAAGTWNLLLPYTYVLPNGQIIRVVGSPNLSNVQTMMLGVRNPLNKNGVSLCGEVWFNELRVTDFNERGGWAANLRVTAKLADLGTITLAGNHATVGFGSIEQKINERSKSETSGYDFSSNVELGRFLPAKTGIRIPFFFGYSEQFVTPEFNPLDPDVPYKTAVDAQPNDVKKDSIRQVIRDYTQRKSFNFTNVKKNKTGGGKPKVYDVENLTFSYAYTELYHHDINIDYQLETTYRGGIGYNFNNNPKNVTPFAKMGGKSKYLRPIKDFNFFYAPSSLAIRFDLDRSYSEMHVRNNTGLQFNIPSTYNKVFNFNRAYDFKWDLAKSLKFDFIANAQARIDEPLGKIDTKEERDTLFQNILSLGRLTSYRHSANVNYTLPLNKFPLLDWISMSARYGGDYGWVAGPLVLDSSTGKIGAYSPNQNIINNAQNQTLNGQFNLVTLYNKVAYFKKINTVQGSKGPQMKIKPRKPPKPKTAQDSIRYKAYEDSLKLYNGPNPLEAVAKTVARLVMSVKQASFTYTETDAMSFPGFIPTPTFLGNSWGGSIPAPGLDFVAGFQNELEYKNRFRQNGWLGTDSSLNAPFSRSALYNFSGRATVEPFKNFKIELTANRNYSKNHTEFYKYDPARDEFRSYSPLENGNFSMSFLAWNTTFVKDNDDYTNSTFQQFGYNRQAISQRLGEQNPNSGGRQADGFYNGYNGTQQQVLTFAFLSAYAGKNPATMALNEFPDIPLPNWRITYDGLGKIPALQKIFSSVNISHGYRSSYSVSSFSQNLLFARDPVNGFDDARDAQDNIIPQYTYQQIGITEQFSPLIGVDVQLKNNVQIRVDFKRDRTVSLSFSNIQITEIRGVEYNFGLGYRIQKFKLPFKLFGNRPISGNLDLKGQFDLRDNTTIIRQLEQGTNQPTAGTEVVSLKLSADYAVNERFTVRLFFDRIMNTPFVSLSYPTANTNAGFSIRFTLAQ